MKDPQPPQHTSPTNALITIGAEIAGGAAGGALGFFAAGPAGAALFGAGGAAVALALKRGGEEISKRLLGPREQVRIGAVIAIAADDIRARMQRNQKLREDGFFQQKPNGRSDAEEVVEGVLQKAQREVEEKKVPHMGYLLANLAFAPDISAPMAHQLLKAAEQLTYRQLCILKLAVVKNTHQLRTKDYRGQGTFTKDLYQVLYECLDLERRGLINMDGEAVLGVTDILPAKFEVQGLGGDLYNLMRLSSIPDEELSPIAAQLK